jgi:hypothetical protein
VTVVDANKNNASDEATVKVGAGAGVGLQSSYTLTLLNDPANTLSVPRGGSASVVIALNGMNGYAGQPTLLAGPAPAGISVSFPYGAQETAGNVTAVISAAATATTAPFALQITGKDGTNFPQGSVTIFVTLTGGPLNVTSSVVYSNIDPVAHTGTTATLVANATGGVGPYSYSWSGGGAFAGNRLAMTAPASPVGGTLTVTDSSSPPQVASMPLTIQISPVVSDAALYVSVFSRILAAQSFAKSLDPFDAGTNYFTNLMMAQANLRQPLLTQAQYNNLVALAGSYKASLASDPANTLLLSKVQASDTGIGSAFPAFDAFAWANYAPNVQYFGGGGPGDGPDDNLYVMPFAMQDPVTGKIMASASAMAGVGAIGDEGDSLYLSLSVYDTSRYDSSGTDYEGGETTATFASESLQPNYPGDVYVADAYAVLQEYTDDFGGISDSQEDYYYVPTVACSPLIQGILVEGVPTNAFVAGKTNGTLTVTGSCLDHVSQVSFQSVLGLSAGAPSAVGAASAPEVGPEQFTASYAVTAGSPASQGYMTVTTPYGSATAPVQVVPALPYISSINPDWWPAGSSTTVTISGAGFGGGPWLGATQGVVSIASQYAVNWVLASWSDGQITGTVTPSANDPGEAVTVSVTGGSYGLGFQAGQGVGQPSPSAPATVEPRGEVMISGLAIAQAATPNAVDGTVPSSGNSITSTNRSSAFAVVGAPDCSTSPTQNACLMTVLKNSGTLTVTAQNPQPAASATQIQWQIDRDPTDTVETGMPVISGSPGAQITFQPSAAGNFRLTAYVDLNGNGVFDEGEQLGVLQIAVVRATLLTGIFTVQNTLAGTGNSSVVTDPSRNVQVAPMRLGAQYLLEGGGSARNVGVGAVTIGDVGNLVSDTLTVAYPVPTGVTRPPGNVPGSETESPGGPLPMVDTEKGSRGSGPTGGATAFRATSTLSEQPGFVPGTGGRAVQIISGDGPVFQWDNFHPATGNPWASTAGSNVFREFLAAFSSDFPQTYAALSQAGWTITPAGINDSGWEDPNSTSSVTGTGAGLQAVSNSVQVLGLSFRYQHTMQHVP